MKISFLAQFCFIFATCVEVKDSSKDEIISLRESEDYLAHMKDLEIGFNAEEVEEGLSRRFGSEETEEKKNRRDALRGAFDTFAKDMESSEKANCEISADEIEVFKDSIVLEDESDLPDEAAEGYREKIHDILRKTRTTRNRKLERGELGNSSAADRPLTYVVSKKRFPKEMREAVAERDARSVSDFLNFFLKSFKFLPKDTNKEGGNQIGDSDIQDGAASPSGQENAIAKLLGITEDELHVLMAPLPEDELDVPRQDALTDSLSALPEDTNEEGGNQIGDSDIQPLRKAIAEGNVDVNQVVAAHSSGDPSTEDIEKCRSRQVLTEFNLRSTQARRRPSLTPTIETNGGGNFTDAECGRIAKWLFDQSLVRTPAEIGTPAERCVDLSNRLSVLRENLS